MLSNVVVALICWHERRGDVLYGMHSPVVAFCLTFRILLLCLIVYVPISCLNNEVLLKAMTGVALNSFSNVLVQALMPFNFSVF